MKKFFAFLSTMLLTIAFIGLFATNSVKAAEVAEGKFIEDPNLLENEDPVYIMGSIYSTYPALYDNDAQADANKGTYLCYPWNGTRLRMAQFDLSGNPTDRYWAVYLAGIKDETGKSGNGSNILFFEVDEDGNVIGTRSDYGAASTKGQAYSPSLSTVRVNISGQDIEFNPWTDGKTMFGNTSEAETYSGPQIIFDGLGRAVRGVGYLSAYESGERSSTTFEAEYCYAKDGSVVSIASLENGIDDCARKQVPATDSEGNAILDVNQNPVYEDGPDANVVASRFVWEWFEEKPTNVNENGYLNSGWDASLWDYCYEKDGGWMCIAFVTGDGSKFVINETEELKAYAETLYQRALAANPDMTEEQKTQAKSEAEKAAKGYQRACVTTVRVPEGGYVYTQAYLDKNKGNTNDSMNSSVISGYLYGRNAVTTTTDAEGNVVKTYMGSTQTFNYISAELEFEEKVINNKSYQFLENQMVVEVMQGEVFTPTTSINYDAVKKYWQTDGDFTSFKSSADALDFHVSESVNGDLESTKVAPPTGYANMAEVRAALAKDLATYWLKTAQADDTSATYESVLAEVSASLEDTSSGVYLNNIKYEATKPMMPTAEGGTGFLTEFPEWKFLYEGWLETCYHEDGTLWATQGVVDLIKSILEKGFVSSNYTYRIWFAEFLKGTVRDWYKDGNNESWIDPAAAVPSLEAWENYTIDTTNSVPGDNFVVTFKVDNKDSGKSSSLTVKYVVVDSYTPILEVEKEQFNYIPTLKNDKVVCDPVDKYSLVKAYDAQYNGVSIKGNDISQYIKFETEFDFDNPKEGTYEVKVSVKNNTGTKEVTKTFKIKVMDITAPTLIVRNVTIIQGSDFNCLDAIVIAYDNVDGDLKTNIKNSIWWSATGVPTDTNVVDYENAKNNKHLINLTVKDTSGNSSTEQFNLIIVPREAAGQEVQAEIKELSKTITSLNNALDDVLSEQENQAELIEQLRTELANLTNLVNNNKTSLEDVKTSVEEVTDSLDSLSGKVSGGCGSGALLVLELAGAASLLALVLRKRH